MENRFMFSHLCSVDLLSFTSPQVRIPGDLIWRWALSCEHEAQQAGCARLRAPPLCQSPHLRSCLPTWLGTSLPQHGQPESPGCKGPRKHSLLQGDKLSSCQAFLTEPATTFVVQFQEHWNLTICCLPKTYLFPDPQLASLPWG